ncbi:SixA phosphatase family protein [Robertkochia marina]|nr:phosphoglycerate mutase family protein [Robertkochia marina]
MQLFRLLPILCLLFALTACNSSSKKNGQQIEEESSTVFYLIRHAEKDRSDPEEKDPALTPEGQLRANYWSDLFREVPFSAVYSTDYARTRQTAEPTAASKQLNTMIYENGAALVKEWIAQHKGGHVLVVGHSNTIPGIANALLGEEKYSQIEDTNNANLYIVHVKGQNAESILLQPEPINRNHMVPQELP